MKESIHEGYEKAKDVAHEAVDKPKEAARHVGDKAKEAGHDLKEKTKDVGHEVGEKAREATHYAGEKAKERGEQSRTRPSSPQSDYGCPPGRASTQRIGNFSRVLTYVTYTLKKADDHDTLGYHLRDSRAIAAVLGFGGLAGDFASITKILLFLFLILFVVSLVLGRRSLTSCWSAHQGREFTSSRQSPQP